MRILLLNTNVSRGARHGVDATPAPLGLMTLAGVLRRAGHIVRIAQPKAHVLSQDEIELPLVREELSTIIQNFSPELIGLSARNVGASRRPRNPLRLLEYFSVYYDARLVKVLRSVAPCPIVMGGTAFSLEPGLYLRVAAPDFGLVGEAEETILELVSALEAGRQPVDIKGLVCSLEDIPGALERLPFIQDLSSTGSADCACVDDFTGDYYRGGGYAGIQTKRGCALRCIYCTTPNLEGRSYRVRPMDQVMDEVRALVDRWGVRHFFVVDAAFNHPPSSAFAFCDAIRNCGREVQWVAELNPKGVTLDLCRAMAGAGCIGVTLGLESCSDRVLSAYQKDFCTDDILSCINHLKAAGIPFDCSIILGGPGDGRETFRETVAFCERHLADDVVRFFDGMVITRQSPAFAQCVRAGLIDPSVTFEDLILANDFRRVRSYTHFFPDVVEDRKAFLREIEESCSRGRWIYNARDFVADAETGEYTLAPHISIDPEVRPYWPSLKRC